LVLIFSALFEIVHYIHIDYVHVFNRTVTHSSWTLDWHFKTACIWKQNCI